MNNLTRGGLSPAKIINQITKEEVNFMFNPYEFEIKKTVQWNGGEDSDGGGSTRRKPAGVDAPPQTFTSGNPRSISLLLHFDTQEAGTAVTSITSKLWKMTMIDPSTENAQSKKGTPPNVVFKWGPTYFPAVIKSIGEKFTLFSENGTPLRCEVSLDLEEAVDESSNNNNLSNNTSSTPPPTTATFTQSSRLDIMAQVSGLSMRALMEKNDIDNPLDVQNGQVLLV